MKFKDILSIVAIAKNEADYIEEWIEYHKIIGVDRIYLYDNESTDNLKNKIQKYIDSGYVIYKYYPGKGKQLEAYNDAVFKIRNKTKYVAIIDCDEFIVCKENVKLSVYIDSIFNKFKSKFISGLAINWCMFGSSNHITKPDGLVIENYLYFADRKKGHGSYLIKSIVKPKRVITYRQPHSPIYFPGFYCIDEYGNKVKNFYNVQDDYGTLKINHYFTKSKEEWIKRRSLGKADSIINEKRPIDEFYQYDNNDIFDNYMLKYVQGIVDGINK